MDRTTIPTPPRRLLGVWAHPDDEAYLSAALMARVIDAGGSVTVVTATRGECGTHDPSSRGSVSFGALREAELRAGLAVLGVTDLRLLGLRDGRLADEDAEAQTAAVGTLIDEVDPDVIVTFGPDGMTWHPDHQAVSAWTTRAAEATGHGDDLLYATMTDDFAARHAPLHARLGLFDDWGPGHPATTPRDEVVLECVMTADELERKRRALGQHSSQIEAVVAAFGERGYLEWLHQETFRRPTPAELRQEALR